MTNLKLHRPVIAEPKEEYPQQPNRALSVGRKIGGLLFGYRPRGKPRHQWGT
jgi:hypothetical protein